MARGYCVWLRNKPSLSEQHPCNSPAPQPDAAVDPHPCRFRGPLQPISSARPSPAWHASARRNNDLSYHYPSLVV